VPERLPSGRRDKPVTVRVIDFNADAIDNIKEVGLASTLTIRYYAYYLLTLIHLRRRHLEKCEEINNQFSKVEKALLTNKQHMVNT